MNKKGFSLIQAAIAILFFSICIPSIFRFAQSLYLGTIRAHNMILQTVQIKNYFYDKPEKSDFKIVNSQLREHALLKRIESEFYSMVFVELQTKDFEIKKSEKDDSFEN